MINKMCDDAKNQATKTKNLEILETFTNAKFGLVPMDNVMRRKFRYDMDEQGIIWDDADVNRPALAHCTATVLPGFRFPEHTP